MVQIPYFKWQQENYEHHWHKNQHHGNLSFRTCVTFTTPHVSACPHSLNDNNVHQRYCQNRHCRIYNKANVHEHVNIPTFYHVSWTLFGIAYHATEVPIGQVHEDDNRQINERENLCPFYCGNRSSFMRQFDGNKFVQGHQKNLVCPKGTRSKHSVNFKFTDPWSIMRRFYMFWYP